MEMLIVIIVLGALAGLALPRYGASIEKTKSAEGVQILQSLREAQELYKFEHGDYTDTYADLEIEIPEPKHFDAVSDDSISDSDPIAVVSRSTGDYDLRVYQNGDIRCHPNVENKCDNFGLPIEE